MTSEVHNFFIFFFHLVTFSFYFGLLIRIIFGLLSFWCIFLLVELLKISLHLSIGVFNFSTIIQISLIMNFEWVYSYEDNVRIRLLLIHRRYLMDGLLNGRTNVLPSNTYYILKNKLDLFQICNGWMSY